jgi:hypothetical protein
MCQEKSAHVRPRIFSLFFSGNAIINADLSVSGWGSVGPFVSVIIFLHEADDGGTQMLTKSPGISSSAGKW